jgi:hypothetical protein
MDRIPAEVIAAVDDTAEYAFDNVVQMRAAPANRANDATIDQCYTALQQSLAHYRSAGKMNAAQAQREHLMLRAKFLRAEAALMFDEQWEAFGTELWAQDGQRISRNSTFDVQGCMAAWEVWDADGFKLHHQLLHRADCAELEAKAVQS